MVELDWPVRPDSPYAVGKLFGENLGRYYPDKHGLSTLVIRLGGVFPDDRPQRRRQQRPPAVRAAQPGTRA